MARVLCVLFAAVVFLAGCAPKSATPGATPAPKSLRESDLTVWKQRVLDYSKCEGGLTVEKATVASLRGVRVQEIKGTKYVTHDAKLAKIAIEYKAANGADKAVTFNLRFDDGQVNAEDNDALAILRLMETGCRQR